MKIHIYISWNKLCTTRVNRWLLPHFSSSQWWKYIIATLLCCPTSRLFDIDFVVAAVTAGDNWTRPRSDRTSCCLVAMAEATSMVPYHPSQVTVTHLSGIVLSSIRHRYWSTTSRCSGLFYPAPLHPTLESHSQDILPHESRCSLACPVLM